MSLLTIVFAIQTSCPATSRASICPQARRSLPRARIRWLLGVIPTVISCWMVNFVAQIKQPSLKLCFRAGQSALHWQLVSITEQSLSMQSMSIPPFPLG